MSDRRKRIWFIPNLMIRKALVKRVVRTDPYIQHKQCNGLLEEFAIAFCCLADTEMHCKSVANNVHII